MYKFEKLGKLLNIDWNKVDKKQFEMGMKVEREHDDLTSGDPKKTAMITLAHLKEFPDYYSRLKKMENK